MTTNDYAARLRALADEVDAAEDYTATPADLAMLTALFAELEAEGFGTADGPMFTAHPGLEEFAAVRLEMLIGDRESGG